MSCSKRWFIAAALALTFFGARAQLSLRTQAEAMRLRELLTQQHVEPIGVNQEFSDRVFTLLIRQLDGQCEYFTAGEIAELRNAAGSIDEELNDAAPWKFLPSVIAMYRKCLDRALVAESSRKLASSQAVEAGEDSLWSANETALRARWNRRFSAEVMEELARQWTAAPAGNDEAFLKSHESDARARVRERTVRSIKKILQHPEGFESRISALFLRAISMAFDPHSVYLTRSDMEDFMASLSTEGYFFGIDLGESEDGEIVVTGLLPGGPAWKSGEIRAGDVVEKMRWTDQDWVDLNGYTEREAEDILTESNHAPMDFQLRTASGMRKTVRLRKERLNSEESVVRSFVLAGNRRIGYISLPDFYSSWGNSHGAACAEDVGKELVKLRKENIDGLILDVRFNGGGSMHEAVALAGIFIDAGPVGLSRDRGAEPVTIKDVNRGTLYDGPLLVLVNGMSASASEFLAAALRDYNRAIIAGTPTFGKGIAQEIFSLEPGRPRLAAAPDLSKPWGYCTITRSRLYRINGRGLQQNGVTPDIGIPDWSAVYEMRERLIPYSLDADSVSKKTYATVLPGLPLAELRRRSEERLAGHQGFEAMRRYIAMATRGDGPPSSDWNAVRSAAVRVHEERADLEKAMLRNTGAYTVVANTFSKPRLEFDEYSSQVNEAWIRNLSRDISLEEAYFIICDYVEATTRH